MTENDPKLDKIRILRKQVRDLKAYLDVVKFGIQAAQGCVDSGKYDKASLSLDKLARRIETVLLEAVDPESE